MCWLLLNMASLADVSVSRPSTDRMRMSWHAGACALTNTTQWVYGRLQPRTDVRLEDALPDYDRHGEPAVPFYTCRILLPPGKRATRVEPVSAQWMSPYDLDYPMAFINQPYTGYDMSDPADAAAWAQANHPDAVIFSSSRPYPENPIAFTNRIFRGYSILYLKFSPFVYRGSQKRLQLQTRIRFEINLKDQPAYGTYGLRDKPADREIVRNMTVNGMRDLETYYPQAGLNTLRGGTDTNYYVIITDTNFASSFDEFAAFHSYDATHTACVVTIDSILDYYAYTNAWDHLKLQWYIRDQLYSNGTEYVLIGGDVDVVTSYWSYSDFHLSEGQIPVGRFPADSRKDISNCVAKSMVALSNGSDRVQFIPRADEVGPGLVTYTNIFVPYMEVDIDSDLYNGQPDELFAAMDSHSIIWARGHGYYLYPHTAPAWYAPDNTNIQPVCVNFGCSGCIITWDDHPAEAYANARYGNMAYIGTVLPTTMHSFGVRFFESYLIDGTAGPRIGDMMVIAWPSKTLMTLLGDPRYAFVSPEFQSLPRISCPGYDSLSRSYNPDSGSGVVESASFTIHSFNDCPWVITNVWCNSAMSNHFALSCMASDVTMEVIFEFLDVTNIAPDMHTVYMDIRDAANDLFIERKTVTLTVTDKNILTPSDFVTSGMTNRLPAGTYYLVEDLDVCDGETLVLDPGVELTTDWEFGTDWRIIVRQGGTLLAAGSVTNSICFGQTMQGLPIEIHRTDLMPFSAEFAYCQFAHSIIGSNVPTVNFLNCTFVLPSSEDDLFPNRIEGAMRNCVITPANMGCVGEMGNLSGFDIAYSCLTVSTTNGLWDPTVPIYCTQGSNNLWANDYVGFGMDLAPSLASPCINGGDPDSPLDPDGTRADMGATYVDLSSAVRVPDDYTNIQQAVDAARTLTTAVMVAQGVYNQAVEFSSSMGDSFRLIGASETSMPQLVVTNADRGILSFNADTLVENMRITHIGSNRSGCAVSLTSDMVNVGFRNCVFEYNRDNDNVFSLCRTTDWAQVGFYMEHVRFENNQSNNYLISVGKGLSSPSMAMDTWNWLNQCRFSNNTDIDILFNYSPSNCCLFTRGLTFEDNRVNTLIYNSDNSSSSNAMLVLQNALFVGNEGALISGDDACTVLENCTLFDNGSNILARANAEIQIVNAILWSNVYAFTEEDGGMIQVDYSDMDMEYAGTGNMTTNPLFTDAANRDYRLMRISPCIDAGNPATPYDNEPGPNGGRVNLGCHGNTPRAAVWKAWQAPKLAFSNNQFIVNFDARTNEYYCTEYASELTGPWTNLCSQAATGSTSSVHWTPPDDRGFFRVFQYRP